MNPRFQWSAALPVKRSLSLEVAITLLITAIMAIASVIGLLHQAASYPTQELVQAFVPNDVVNLFIGLPILLVSIFLARRGKLVGLLLWPGALFYVFYTYLVYMLGMPLNAAFLLHITLVILSAYSLISLVASIDGKAVQDQLSGKVPERAAGIILAVLASLFFVRVMIALITAVIGQTPLTRVELGLNLADFLTTPAWIIGGLLLWRRKAFGYVTGLGLLFQASMLFVGLIIILILQPFLIAASFSLIDVLVVAAMGMVSFVPFALFIRGAALKRT